MEEDTPEEQSHPFKNFSQDLDLEHEESDYIYSERSYPNVPHYEPRRADVDSDNDEPRSRSKPAVGKGVKGGALCKPKGRLVKLLNCLLCHPLVKLDGENQ